MQAGMPQARDHGSACIGLFLLCTPKLVERWQRAALTCAASPQVPVHHAVALLVLLLVFSRRLLAVARAPAARGWGPTGASRF